MHSPLALGPTIHPAACACLRASVVAGVAFAFAAAALAQVVRPPPGGGGGGGMVPPGGRPGGGGGGLVPVNPGGGGGGATQGPRIVTPSGVIAGDTAQAGVVVQPAPPAGTTYQWTISGGRITTDPARQTIAFVGDTAGTITLTAVVTSGSTTQTATANVSVISAALAGTIAAPATVATGAASIVASVPPAQEGDRTFRWSLAGPGAAIISGQGTNSVTVRPGTPGLLEITCDVILQRLVSVPLRSFVMVTGDGPASSLTINAGSGGGTYPAGSRVDIFADAPPAGQVFDRWVGDTAVLGTGALAPTLARAVATIPATAATLTATYKPAPTWSPTTVANFNPIAEQSPNGTTLIYHMPAGAQALVVLLHETGGTASEWFTSPEQLLLARDLVSANYGVAALDSVNRATGAWSGQPVLANNADASTLAAALDKFTRDGALAGGKPIFLLGLAAGGDAAARYAQQLSAAGRPVKGAILYCAAGAATLAVTSRVPHLFALAANDDQLGLGGANSARANAQLLAGRGVAAGMFTNAPAPVHSRRFRRLGLNAPTFTATDAEAVWNALKTADFLDANNYPRTAPTTAAVRAALPAAYQARAADVASQLAVAFGARKFFSDANARVLAFLNARVNDAPAPTPARLVNLSTRTKIAFLGDTFTLGFNLSGPERATLLIRGIGPALTKFGLSNALPSPRLEVLQGSTVVAANEGWEQASNAAQIAAAATSVGAFALAPGDRDAAVLVTLEPGTYTATVKGLGGTSGDVLAEVYDVSKNATRLTNLSTLAKVTSEGELLIPGIALAGTNPRTLMVRAIGSGLTDFGLSADAVLGDPRILVLNASGQTVATNNNWSQAGAATLNAAFPAVGAFPLRAASDAALINALAPGTYTLQAGAAPIVEPPPGAEPAPPRVVPNVIGALLVEVYEVP